VDTRLWQPALFRDTEVWVPVTEGGAVVADARGIVTFRYQLNGKDYGTRPDRLVLRDGPPVATGGAGAGAGRAHKPGAARPQAAEALAGEALIGGAPRASGPRATRSIGAAVDIEVWTDGACSGNPGPAGLGVHLRVGGSVRELSEFLGEGTNNIAELMAILRGLEMIDDRGASVAVMTDSAYSIGLLTQGWKPKANQALVAELRGLAAGFTRLAFVKVAGHAGVEGNERADALARLAITTRRTTRTGQGG
jgi:ribonuclease HI